MRALGAEVVEFGDDFQEARERSIIVAAERGLEAVPPFHPDLVLGVATYAKELFDADGALDTVYVPVGMGSGINALIAVRDLLGLDTQIVGVVSDGAPSTRLSFERGEVVTTESASTFVDGVATRSPDPISIAGILRRGPPIVVSDDATADAMRIIFRTTHNVAESAGAIGLAGLLSEPPAQRGHRSAFVLCGGNVDSSQFLTVLGEPLRRPDVRGRSPTAQRSEIAAVESARISTAARARRADRSASHGRERAGQAMVGPSESALRARKSQ